MSERNKAVASKQDVLRWCVCVATAITRIHAGIQAGSTINSKEGVKLAAESFQAKLLLLLLSGREEGGE